MRDCFSTLICSCRIRSTMAVRARGAVVVRRRARRRSNSVIKSGLGEEAEDEDAVSDMTARHTVSAEAVETQM